MPLNFGFQCFLELETFVLSNTHLFCDIVALDANALREDRMSLS
jgi:hypothetical protein